MTVEEYVRSFQHVHTMLHGTASGVLINITVYAAVSYR